MFSTRALVCAALVVALAGCSSSSSEQAKVSATTTTVPAPTGSQGCGKAVTWPRIGTDRPGDVARSLTVDGTTRTYRIGIPRELDVDTPVPLVVQFHGAGSSALAASAHSDLPRAATKRGWVTVTPDAIAGKWQYGPQGSDADFVAALVDEVEATMCIDPDRVHLIGMSLGAWKTAITGCAGRGRYASMSLVTVEVFPGRCDPMAVLAFHGTADPVVAYGPGGGSVDAATTPNEGVPGALTNIASWAESNGCSPTPAVTRIGDDVVLRRFLRCDPGADVDFYTILGGGHTWPGTTIIRGEVSQTTHTIDATQLALDFFAAHPRGAYDRHP